jgi:hypothetical protein
MFASLYDLIKASILILNAVAIINERFLRTSTCVVVSSSCVRSLSGTVLRSVGKERPALDAPNTPKNRILTLLHGDAKLVLRSTFCARLPIARSELSWFRCCLFVSQCR